ncbi:MAG: hypothetical protein QM601_05640 [Pseudoxanthomonas sp.]
MARRLPWLLLISLLPWAVASVAAQETGSGASGEWTADAKANKQAQKEAEKASAGQGRGGKKPRDGQPPSDGGGAPPSGGMDGGMSGSMGDPGGDAGDSAGGPPGKGGPGGEPGQAEAADMLLPQMDFAAPLKGDLVLYRTRESVLFGRTGAEPVILPLSGEAVTVAPGITASAHEQDGKLRVDMVTTNDIHTSFRYDQSPDGTLRVDVHAEGPYPHTGSRFDVRRTYRAKPAKQ